MIDMDENAVVRWNGTSKKWFEDKGYSYTKLGDYFSVKIKDLPKGSGFKISYTCDYCGGKFCDKTYYNLLKQRKTIPKDVCVSKECKNKKRKEMSFIIFFPKYEDTLEYRFPDITNEWNFDKNKDLKPKEVHHGSGKLVWWKCSNNHEWEDSIGNRTRNNTKCKICQRNSYNLAKVFPELALEWHPTLNGTLTPQDISPNNQIRAWWICKEGHEWETTVGNRSVRESGCPICYESKGEKRIREWLINNNMEFEPQKEYENLRGVNSGLLSYDFYLPSCNILIEYQGQQHERPIDFLKIGMKDAKRRFIIQQEHDRRKREYADKNYIELLEIWYRDFERIEEILLEKFFK